MNVQQQIEQQLQERFQPSQLEVVNESHMHSVPPNSETHFKVLVVSEAFEGVILSDIRMPGRDGLFLLDEHILEPGLLNKSHVV